MIIDDDQFGIMTQMTQTAFLIFMVEREKNKTAIKPILQETKI